MRSQVQLSSLASPCLLGSLTSGSSGGAEARTLPPPSPIPAHVETHSGSCPGRGRGGRQAGPRQSYRAASCTALRLYILHFNKITVKAHRALQRGRYQALSTERGWWALSGLAEIRWKSSVLSGVTAPLTTCMRHAFHGMSRNRAAA